MINHRLMELNFSQIVNVWKQSQHNQYSNIKKKEYHKKLGVLFDKLKVVDFNALSETERKEYYSIMKFFSLSLEYLKNSTMNTVPYELIYCLRCALDEWVLDSDRYIIVTSYGDYCFSGYLSLSKWVYDIMKSKLGIEFEDKLIQICLPQGMERDYLCNTVLYHELGHFVDMTIGLSKIIFMDLKKHYAEPEVKEFFPYLDDVSISNNEKDLLVCNHLQEYFADLFASLYIGKSVYYYLDYIANEDKCSYSHPATSDRIKLVDLFLADPNSNILFKIINNYTTRIFKQELKPKNQAINSPRDFYDLIPCEITNKSQLHTIFLCAWDIWMNNTNEFESANRMNFTLKPSQKYEIVNNLIEKSINNFIVKEKWTRA